MKELHLIHNFDQIDQIKTFCAFLKDDASKHEVILSTKAFSRVGRLSLDDLTEAVSLLKGHDVKCYLQWDILMVESVFKATSTLFKSLKLEKMDGVRVQDPGALYFLKQINFDKDIHFIVDQGNHNLLGLNQWLRFWPERIKRFVLSPEVPFKIIETFLENLTCDLEVYGAGEILLFYTPRSLVSPLYGETEDEVQKKERLEVWGTSEESPHKGFPIIENQHGTFMFNTKELFIFDEREGVSLLDRSEKCFFRIDYSMNPLGPEGLSSLMRLISWESREEESEASYRAHCKTFVENHRPKPCTRGFFKVNKTDVLFKKLKSNRLKSERSNFLGEVIDVKKKKHVGIKIADRVGAVKLGDAIELTSPEGNIKSITLSNMKNARGDSLTEAKGGQVIFIPSVGGISVKTQVCLLQTE